MNFDSLYEYCMSKVGAQETFPFDETTLVFKVGGKMFAATSISREPLTINLKCDPEKALDLRERHPDIVPGYHMNKKHWNTIATEGELEEKHIQELIDHSYDLVIKSLPKRIRDELQAK